MSLSWARMACFVHSIVTLCTIVKWLRERKRPLLEGGPSTAGAQNSGEIPSSPRRISYLFPPGGESLFWINLLYNKYPPAGGVYRNPQRMLSDIRCHQNPANRSVRVTFCFWGRRRLCCCCPCLFGTCHSCPCRFRRRHRWRLRARRSMGSGVSL